MLGLLCRNARKHVSRFLLILSDVDTKMSIGPWVTGVKARTHLQGDLKHAQGIENLSADNSSSSSLDGWEDFCCPQPRQKVGGVVRGVVQAGLREAPEKRWHTIHGYSSCASRRKADIVGFHASVPAPSLRTWEDAFVGLRAIRKKSERARQEVVKRVNKERGFLVPTQVHVNCACKLTL